MESHIASGSIAKTALRRTFVPVVGTSFSGSDHGRSLNDAQGKHVHIRSRGFLYSLAVYFLAALLVGRALAEPPPLTHPLAPPPPPPTIVKGASVALKISVRIDEMEAIQAFTASNPLKYIHGTGELLPALESAIEGLAQGSSKDVTLSEVETGGPAEGPNRQQLTNDDRLSIRLPRDRLPNTNTPEDTYVTMVDPGGGRWIARVVHYQGDTVVLELPPLLSGHKVVISVTVVSVAAGPGQ